MVAECPGGLLPQRTLGAGMDQIIDIGWSLAGIAGVGFLAFIAHRHHSGRAKLTPDERAALDREADREANIW